MELLNQFLSTYGMDMLSAAITAVVGYAAIVIKNLYTKYVNNSIKMDVARTCVRAVEQIYKDLHGDEKLSKCIESIVDMLSEKGIAITDIEVRMLIESAVCEFNKEMKKKEASAE